MYALANIDDKLLTSFTTLATLEQADKTIAAESAAKAKDLEDVWAKLKTAREELATLEKDLARLREDAKAVGDRGALAQPLVTRIVAAEDRLGIVRTRISDLEKEDKAKTEALRTSLSRLPK
jgi:chromosome segregation ATPase